MPLPRTRSLVAAEGTGETAVRPFSPAGVGGKTLRLHTYLYSHGNAECGVYVLVIVTSQLVSKPT